MARGALVVRGGQSNTPGALRAGDTDPYYRAREGGRLNIEWWFTNREPRNYLDRYFHITFIYQAYGSDG